MVISNKNPYTKIACLSLTFSLCTGQFSAMQEVPVREYEDQVKSKYTQATLPHELSFFKKHVVEIPSSNSKQLSLALGQPEGMFIIDYNLDGKTIGQLIQTNGVISFESHDPQNYDFLMQSPLRTSNLAIDVLGKFVFQKPIDIETASVSSKSVEFRDKFSSAKTISLDVDYGDNYGDIACTDFSFKGNRFSCMEESKLTARGSLALLAKQGLLNDGQILCTDKALISTPSFKNLGVFNVGNLFFENGNIFNTGSILVDGSFMGLCNDFDHKGKLKVGTDCILEKVNNLKTWRSSSWHVGSDWKATVANLYLAGNIQVGNLSLFKVDSDATLAGPFCASIIHVDSNNSITCDFPARLIATHHIGLKAKGWIEYQGDVFKTFVHEAKKLQEFDKENALFKIFPSGVFLRSAQNGIKKSGSIVSRSGTVALDAKKGLTHAGITDAGVAPNALLLMNGASLNIEKNSLLKSLYARLQAQNSIELQGAAQIEETLAAKAPQIIMSGPTQVGSFVAQADTFKALATSDMQAKEKIAIETKQGIEQAGSMETPGDLLMQGQNITLEPNSKTRAENADIVAEETVTNRGLLEAKKQLRARGKYVLNEDQITAQDAHIKADRVWWNQYGAKMNAERQLVIDALISINTLGLLQGESIEINAGIDLNLLGIYHAKRMSINALIGFNAGLLVPRFDSVDDVFSWDNAKLAGERLLCTFSPQARLAIGIIRGIYTIATQAPELLKAARDAYSLENAGVSDWLSVICGVKNLAMTTYQTGRMTHEGAKMAWHLKEMVDPINMGRYLGKMAAEKYQEPADIDWQATFADHAPSIARDAASSIASTFGPQMNREMLIDINMGAMLGVNGSSNSIWNVNTGVCAFANTYSLNTVYGTNRGLLAADYLNVNALRTFTNARAMAANKMFVQAHTYQGSEDSTIKSAQSHIQAHILNNKGATTGSHTAELTSKNANDLKSLGKGEKLLYKGPLNEGLADKLVAGKNDLLQVAPTGSVGIDTDGNAHLEEAHNVSHAVCVKAKGNITADKEIKSKRSIGFHAGKDLNHKDVEAAEIVKMFAGRTVKGESEVTRTQNGANSEDTLTQVAVKGDSVTITAGQNIEHGAVNVESGKGGTTMEARGKIIASEKTTTKHTESTKTNKKSGSVRTKKKSTTKATVSKYASDGGDICMRAGDAAELHGTKFENSEGKTSICAKNAVHGHAVYDTRERESHYKKNGGWFRTSKDAHKKNMSKKAKEVTFKGTSTPEISSAGKISMACTSETKAISCTAPEVEIKTAQSSSASESHSKGENLVWEWEKHRKKEEVAYSPSVNVLQTNADKVHAQDVAGRAPVTIETRNPNMQLTREMFKEIHNHQIVSAQGPTRAASMVIALAISMATAGIGSTLGATVATGMGIKSGLVTTILTNMTSAGFTTLATHSTDQLLRCNGDFHAAAKNIVSSDTFKKLIISTLTAGAVSGANGALAQVVPAVSKGNNILEKLAYAAPRQAATATIRTVADALQGQDLKEAALDNLRSAAASTIGISGANTIGDASHAGTINPAVHKILHAGVGAFSGAVAGGKEGAIAGATGAVVAELVADVMGTRKPSFNRMSELENRLGRQLTEAEFIKLWENQTQTYLQQATTTADIAKLTAAGVAFLARQDVGIAHMTGATAVDNNFLGLLFLGVAAGGTAYSAYNVYSAYHEGGPGAAIQQLGIEVVTEAAGFVTGAVVGKMVGKVGYKFGTKIYPTVERAINAAYDANPGLKLALGKFGDKLIAGAEKLGNTAIGKAAIKADQWALKQTTKISDAFANHVSGLGEDLAAAHVPGSVAAKMEARAAGQAVQAEVHAVETIPLRPLGLGSTGRTEPASLHEQTVLKGVLADPNIGEPIDIKKGMTDSRWHKDDGWQKMSYRNNEHGIEIHYVIQKKDGIITAIDDFKFKNEPRLMFFDYQGKK